MNNWMRYCQKKGLCPDCTKSLCVCSKAHSKMTEDHMHYMSGPDDTDAVIWNAGDEVTHRRAGRGVVVGPVEGRPDRYHVHFPEHNETREVHSDSLAETDNRVRRGAYPPNKEHPERAGKESTGGYQEGYLGTEEDY